MSKQVNIPIILFAYTRPHTLIRTLECLKENNVPLIYAFSDGPGTPDKAQSVAGVREILRGIDWCEVILCERETNLGLGRSILTGVTEVLQNHEMAIIFEDDHICVPGTYDYLCAALEHYRNNIRIMSVTGWTHPLVTPKRVTDQPYFDGRAECWVWGTWARAWEGMTENDALSLMRKCEEQGIDIYRYGADLPEMAKAELKQNIWAVRFLYWHIFNQGLCLRPPWSMVGNIGFGKGATNTQTSSWLKNPPLKECPPIPQQWPEPVEDPECSLLYQRVCGKRPSWYKKIVRPLRNACSVCLRYLSKYRRYP
jgi:hypothetical protein